MAGPGQGPAQAAFYITSRDSPLALAGLWATWRDPSAVRDEDGKSGDDGLFTCAILTTSANGLMESVHHRMPVILAPEAWDALARPRQHRHRGAGQAAGPGAPRRCPALWPVDEAVGNVTNARPELQEPLGGHQPITA